MYTGMFRSIGGNRLCCYDYDPSQVSICSICACSPSHGLLASAKVAEFWRGRVRRVKVLRQNCCRCLYWMAHCAGSDTNKPSTQDCISQLFFAPPPKPLTNAQANAQQGCITMDASFHCCIPKSSNLDRLRAILCVCLHMPVCCKYYYVHCNYCYKIIS